MGKSQGPIGLCCLQTFCKTLSSPVRLLKTVRLLEKLEYCWVELTSDRPLEHWKILSLAGNLVDVDPTKNQSLFFQIASINWKIGYAFQTTVLRLTSKFEIYLETCAVVAACKSRKISLGERAKSNIKGNLTEFPPK